MEHKCGEASSYSTIGTLLKEMMNNFAGKMDLGTQVAVAETAMALDMELQVL